MKVDHWVTLFFLAIIIALVVTHAGGASTDMLAGGKAANQLAGTLSGQNTTAGVNVPGGAGGLF